MRAAGLLINDAGKFPPAWRAQRSRRDCPQRDMGRAAPQSTYRGIRRALKRLRLLKLFGDKIALRRERLAAESGAHHFVDTLGDSGVPIHQNAQVVSVEHE